MLFDMWLVNIINCLAFDWTVKDKWKVTWNDPYQDDVRKQYKRRLLCLLNFSYISAIQLLQSSWWALVPWPTTSETLFGPLIFSVFIQKINSRIWFGAVNSNFWGLQLSEKMQGPGKLFFVILGYWDQLCIKYDRTYLVSLLYHTNIMWLLLMNTTYI